MKRVMKNRHHALLQGRAKVDQHIATGDKIKPGKRRVSGHVVGGKDAGVTQILPNPIAFGRSFEVLREALWTHSSGQVSSKSRLPRLLNRPLADVGGKDLKPNLCFVRLDIIRQTHGD